MESGWLGRWRSLAGCRVKKRVHLMIGRATPFNIREARSRHARDIRDIRRWIGAGGIHDGMVHLGGALGIVQSLVAKRDLIGYRDSPRGFLAQSRQPMIDGE